jgi:uncharacterized protein YecE (DUF72 family)
MPSRAHLPGYRLGLPAWAFPGWRDRYFPARPSPLGGYARVFDAVEGNTTFYRVPDEETVRGWAAAVAGSDFEFCFKVPRTVTHERQPDVADLRRFLASIEPLQGHLGPLLVQLPARVGPAELPVVDALLASLPRTIDKVLEVRHPEFFARPGLLEPLLEEHGCGRVMMDSRPLYEGNREHPEVLEALHEKPDLPIIPEVYGGIAFLRLVLHPDRLDNQRYVDEWASRTVDWLAAGHRVYVMIHCPNNLHCPELAVQFHETLRRCGGGAGAGPLPPWPVPSQQTLW